MDDLALISNMTRCYHTVHLLQFKWGFKLLFPFLILLWSYNCSNYLISTISSDVALDPWIWSTVPIISELLKNLNIFSLVVCVSYCFWIITSSMSDNSQILWVVCKMMHKALKYWFITLLKLLSMVYFQR